MMCLSKGISKSVTERAVVATVNDELQDITRPFEGDGTVVFFDFISKEDKMVFWHSSAHTTGETAERRFGVYLAINLPTTNGFYFETALPENRAEQLLEMLKSIIGDRVPDGAITTIYWCGPLIDPFQTPRPRYGQDQGR
ncbi:hypothetical protein F4678DRAFT_332637 [Xylaria arbuscula]|nr:hypothetical protein F4678DRAFT_332637 [Xylaria arbuscula]